MYNKHDSSRLTSPSLLQPTVKSSMFTALVVDALSNCGEVVLLVARPKPARVGLLAQPIAMPLRERMAMATDNHLWYVNRMSGKASHYRVRKRVTDARRYYTVAREHHTDDNTKDNTEHDNTEDNNGHDNAGGEGYWQPQWTGGTVSPHPIPLYSSTAMSTVFANPALCECLDQVDGLLAEYFPTNANAAAADDDDDDNDAATTDAVQGRERYHRLKQEMHGHVFTNSIVVVPVACGYRDVRTGAMPLDQGGWGQRAQWAQYTPHTSTTSTTDTSSLLQALAAQTGLPLMDKGTIKGKIKGNTEGNTEGTTETTDVEARQRKNDQLLDTIAVLMEDVGLKMSAHMIPQFQMTTTVPTGVHGQVVAVQVREIGIYDTCWWY
jgi:hypothetical protein